MRHALLLLTLLLMPALLAAQEQFRRWRVPSGGEAKIDEGFSWSGLGYVYLIPAIDKPPALDGVADEACWKETADPIFFQGGEKAGAYARILCDSEKIYVMVRFPLPEPPRAVAKQSDDPQIEGDDAVAMTFIAPSGERHRFIINAEGVIRDEQSPPAAAGERPRWDAAWSGRAEVACGLANEAWLLEFSAQLADLGATRGLGMPLMIERRMAKAKRIEYIDLTSGLGVGLGVRAGILKAKVSAQRGEGEITLDAVLPGTEMAEIKTKLYSIGGGNAVESRQVFSSIPPDGRVEFLQPVGGFILGGLHHIDVTINRGAEVLSKLRLNAFPEFYPSTRCGEAELYDALRTSRESIRIRGLFQQGDTEEARRFFMQTILAEWRNLPAWNAGEVDLRADAPADWNALANNVSRADEYRRAGELGDLMLLARAASKRMTPDLVMAGGSALRAWARHDAANNGAPAHWLPEVAAKRAGNLLFAARYLFSAASDDPALFSLAIAKAVESQRAAYEQLIARPSSICPPDAAMDLARNAGWAGIFGEANYWLADAPEIAGRMLAARLNPDGSPREGRFFGSADAACAALLETAKVAGGQAQEAELTPYLSAIAPFRNQDGSWLLWGEAPSARLKAAFTSLLPDYRGVIDEQLLDRIEGRPQAGIRHHPHPGMQSYAGRYILSCGGEAGLAAAVAFAPLADDKIKDFGSVLLRAWGNGVVVDAGRAGDSGETWAAAYAANPFTRNTLEVDKHAAGEDAYPVKGTPAAWRWFASPGIAVAGASWWLPDNTMAARSIISLPGKDAPAAILVCDRVEGTGAGDHMLRRKFQFPSNTKASNEKQMVTAAIEPDKKLLTIWAGGREDGLEIVSGKTGPQPEGWVFGADGKPQVAPALMLKHSLRNGESSIVAFVPAGESAAPKIETRASGGGSGFAIRRDSDNLELLLLASGTKASSMNNAIEGVAEKLSTDGEIAVARQQKGSFHSLAVINGKYAACSLAGGAAKVELARASSILLQAEADGALSIFLDAEAREGVEAKVAYKQTGSGKEAQASVALTPGKRVHFQPK